MHRLARCTIRATSVVARASLATIHRAQVIPAAYTASHSHIATPCALIHTTACRQFAAPTPSDADLVQWQNFNSAGLRLLSEGQHEKASLLFMSAMREPVVQNTVYQYLSLSNLGVSFRHLGRFEEAKQVLLQSLHALKTYTQIHDGMIAHLYREAALACESMDQIEEAEGLLNHSLHYYQQHTLAKEHASNTQSTQHQSSPAEQSKLMLETGATHYTLALLIHKTATSASEAAAANGTKGKNLSVHLRLREAERHYNDALKLMRAVYGSDPNSKQSLLTAPVLSSMGTMYRELGDPTNALARWMEALTVYQQHQDPRLLPLLDAYMELLQKQDPAYEQLMQQPETDNNEKETEPKK